MDNGIIILNLHCFEAVADYWKLMDKVCRRIVERVELVFRGIRHKNKVVNNNCIIYLDFISLKVIMEN